MKLDFLFKTYFIIAWAIFFGVIYLIVLWAQGRGKEINMVDFFSVAISSASLVAGFRLIYKTFAAAYVNDYNVDMDQLYTVLGGLSIMWLSVRNIALRFKKDD